MLPCFLSNNTLKAPLGGFRSPTAPRFRNLHLSAIWLHAFLPKRHPDTADASTPPSGYRFVCKVYHIATRSYFFRFHPIDVPHSKPSPTSASLWLPAPCAN